MQNETPYKEPECWKKLAELQQEIEKLRERIAPIMPVRVSEKNSLVCIADSPLLEKIDEITKLVASITSDIRI